jgi:hypothetical protein
MSPAEFVRSLYRKINRRFPVTVMPQKPSSSPLSDEASNPGICQPDLNYLLSQEQITVFATSPLIQPGRLWYRPAHKAFFIPCA